jgi:hypothetical protein
MASGPRQLTERSRAIISEHAAKHGVVVEADRPIADSSSGIGFPLVRLPTLARLEACGTITAGQLAAGERFHAMFQHAALDALRAADLARVPVAGGPVLGDISPSHERCRRRIAEAVTALGGNGSIAASAVWHVVGLEWSLRKWSLTVRCRHEHGCGILCGALAVLAAHFARGRQL